MRHSKSLPVHLGCVTHTGNNMLSLIARFMGPTWGPSGADRIQVGPMLAPWPLLSGLFRHIATETRPFEIPRMMIKRICPANCISIFFKWHILCIWIMHVTVLFQPDDFFGFIIWYPMQWTISLKQCQTLKETIQFHQSVSWFYSLWPRSVAKLGHYWCG